MPASVLCVDPDPQLCEILTGTLRDDGYGVRAVHDGEAGLKELAEKGADLALIDIQLPRRNGFELLEQIRALPSPASEIPVFLMTEGRITPAYKDRARGAGATAMLSKPVPLAKLQALVRKHIKESPPRVVEVVAEEPTPEQVALEGELRDLDFPSLLHHLHGLRATGALVLNSGRRRKVLAVRDGYPVAVKSNLIGECFGNLLVQRGIITQAEFEESVERLKNREGLQGKILVAMRVLEEDEVANALVEQAEEKLFEIFEWKRGHYEFKPGGRLKGGLALSDSRGPAAWVLEGVRERYPIERIDRFLRKNAARFVVRSESPFYRLQDVALSAVEQGVLDGLDGTQRVGSFARSDEPVRRALYGLMVTGLLEQRGAGRSKGKRSRSREAKQESRDPSADRGLRTELAALAERLRRQTHFEVLGLEPGVATTEDVEAAFEEVARRAHPDLFQHSSGAVRTLADEVFQRLDFARQTLCDPRERKRYELTLRRGEREAAREKQGKRALDAEVEFQKGESLLRERHYEAALLCFGNALQRAPEEGEYIAHYGWCLYLCHPDESAMVEEAIEHVRKGLKLARDHEKPYLFLGRLYKVIGKTEAAERMFTRAVQIQPRSVEALRELRLINMRRRKKGLIGRILRR